MAENARMERGPVALGWQRSLLNGSVARRRAGAFIVAAGLLALLLVVFMAQPLTVLPEYLAVTLAYVAAVVVPGLIVQRAVLPKGSDALSRVAVAPALGLAVLTAPGFLALEAHISLDEFEVLYAFFAATVCGVAMLFSGDEPLPHDASDDSEGGRGSLLLFAMAIVVVGGVLTTPFWASGRLSADFDDWTYMAYVREFLHSDSLNADEPFLGTGEDVNPRMRDNVWVLSQALVSDASGVAPKDLILQYSTPLLASIALLAMYALTRALFGSRSIALLAGLFEAGYGLLDLSAHEGFGRNLFLRITEDKMVAAFILFPIALIFLTRFLSRRSWPAFAGFTLLVLALTFVHPVPLVFLATALGAMALLRLALERNAQELVAPALLAAPVALAAIWPLVQRQLLVDVAPDLFQSEASAITFRDEFHVVDLGHDILMGNYHMILHPLVIAAILLVPLVWLAARRSTGHQLVLAMTAGSLFVFFAPFVSTPVAKLMTPQTLWKMPWMIPTAPVLAFVTYQAVAKVRSWGRLRLVLEGRRKSALAGALLPGLAACLVLAAALIVLDQYRRVDNESFYSWTSEDTVVPGTNASIFRGGIDRAQAALWRLQPQDRDLLIYLDHKLPSGSVVLMEPSVLNRFVPGTLGGVKPVDFGGTAGEGERRRAAEAFARGELSAPGFNRVIDTYGVDYIVVSEVGPATPLVLSSPRLELLRELGPFNVFEVVE